MTTIGRKRPAPVPVVVQCPTLPSRRAASYTPPADDGFMSPKAFEVHSQGLAAGAKRRRPVEGGRGAQELADLDVRAILKEASDLGVELMHAKDRKKTERSKLIKLGAKPQSNQKIPYKIYQGRKKKQEEREARRADRARESQVIGSTLGQKKFSSLPQRGKEKKGGRKEERGGLRELPHFRDGVLKLKGNVGKALTGGKGKGGGKGSNRR